MSNVGIFSKAQYTSSKTFLSFGNIMYSGSTPGVIGSNIWLADFETGDLSQLDSVEVYPGNILEVSASEKQNGNFGLHITKNEGSSRAQGVKLISPMYDFHFSFSIF